MNDPADLPLPSPFLIHRPGTGDDERPDFDEIFTTDGPHVLLNHGDPAAFDQASVSLGTALRASLAGQTRRFTALIGYIGGAVHENDEVDDDPMSIIADELAEGFDREVDATDDDQAGLRLGFSLKPMAAAVQW